MAFQSLDLSCPICHEVFKDPVVLPCSHSFCTDCLRTWWRQKPTRDCPFCKRRSSKGDLIQNLVLRNLCDTFVQQRHKASEEQLCQVHFETFKLFCLTEQQPVCVVCRDSKVHEDHRFRPIAEAAQDLKEELEKSLLLLKENLHKTKDCTKEFEKTVIKIKEQARYTEKQIEKQFLELHNFLSEQQESLIKALREEEEQKTQRMKDKMAAVSREIEALSESIRATEEQLKAPDVSFLLKYKAAVERVQHCPLLEVEPQLDPGALIDQAQHLGNLTFNIWSNMKRLVHFTPVILDPLTASHAVLSGNLTSFTRVRKRLGQADVGMTVVSGSEGFHYGSHSWAVDVGDNDEWKLGVTTDRTGKREEVKFWALSFSNGKYSAESTKRPVSLNPVSRPLRIRVCLDCDKHEVSFYDLDTDTQIHSFAQISQKKLFPFILTTSNCPIKILPQDITLILMY